MQVVPQRLFLLIKCYVDALPYWTTHVRSFHWQFQRADRLVENISMQVRPFSQCPIKKLMFAGISSNLLILTVLLIPLFILKLSNLFTKFWLGWVTVYGGVGLEGERIVFLIPRAHEAGKPRQFYELCRRAAPQDLGGCPERIRTEIALQLRWQGWIEASRL